jgi:hypothetical protein
MPKFVAVTDPEKALSEQHGDPSMAKHRAWESKQYVTVNKLGDNLLPSAPGIKIFLRSTKAVGCVLGIG